MKKIFYFAAAMTVAMFVSCNKDNTNTPEEQGPQVTVATDALVLHLPFEDGSVAVGEGVTFDSKKGSADFVDGFIGKAYSNTSADPATQAYLKYNLAATNAINSLKSFTFSAWVKRPALGSGAFFSVNGGTHDWGSTMQFFFDNSSTNEETGVTSQQFNGRIDTTVEENQLSLWPNVNGPEFAVTDKWFHVVRTYDAATSEWNVYVDGVKFPVENNIHMNGEAIFGDLNLQGGTALYIGGWAAIIDGVNNQGWMTYYNGQLDEVRIYNKALTEKEIAQLNREEKLINLN